MLLIKKIKKGFYLSKKEQNEKKFKNNTLPNRMRPCASNKVSTVITKFILHGKHDR